jgi:hypothetical protein
LVARLYEADSVELLVECRDQSVMNQVYEDEASLGTVSLKALSAFKNTEGPLDIPLRGSAGGNHGLSLLRDSRGNERVVLQRPYHSFNVLSLNSGALESVSDSLQQGLEVPHNDRWNSFART